MDTRFYAKDPFWKTDFATYLGLDKDVMERLFTNVGKTGHILLELISYKLFNTKFDEDPRDVVNWALYQVGEVNLIKAEDIHCGPFQNDGKILILVH